MPSGSKKRRKAKQRKGYFVLPEISVLAEKKTVSKVHEEQGENSLSPNAPVQDSEPGDRDIYSQTDELVEVSDLNVRGFSIQTKELVSGPGTTKDDKNDIANARSLADLKIVSQGSNVEGLDEIETDEKGAFSKIENDGGDGVLNLNFNDELNTSQSEVPELLASDRDLSESVSETKSQDRPMQYMKQEATTPHDPSSVADGKSVIECTLEITKDDSSSVLQGSMLEGVVKQTDPLLNVTEKQTRDSIETVSYGIDDGSLSKCFKQSCEASFMNESFVSERHESSLLLDSTVKTKNHEDAENKHLINLDFDKSEQWFPATEGQTQYFDDEGLYEDEKSVYKRHTVLTTEESNMPHDPCSTSLVVEATQGVESTGGNDEQPGAFELKACNVCLPLDAVLQGDVTNAKDSVSMFNEFSEMDCPTVRNIGQVGDDDVHFQNNANSRAENENNTCALQEHFEHMRLPLDALQGDTTNAEDGASSFNEACEVDRPAVRNNGQAGDDDVCLHSNSNSSVENDNSLSRSEEEDTLFTNAIEVTCVNVPEISDPSVLPGSSPRTSENVNGNPFLKEILSSSISSGPSELSSTLAPSHPLCEAAAHSTEKALPGEAESTQVVAVDVEHTDACETVGIATSMRDELSPDVTENENMQQSDCQVRHKNVVEPLPDCTEVGAVYPTSGEGLEPESQILKPDATDENKNSNNEGSSRQSLDAHDDAAYSNNTE